MQEVSAESRHGGASSAFIKEFDGLEAEGSLVVWDTLLNKFDDLFWGFASLSEFGGVDAFESDARGKGAAIDDVDLATKGFRSVHRVVVGAGDARAESDMDLLVIVLEDGGEEFGVFHLIDGTRSS